MTSVSQTTPAEQPTSTTTANTVLNIVTLAVFGMTLALVAFFVVLRVVQVSLFAHHPSRRCWRCLRTASRPVAPARTG
ncbi:MAG: hypothetical protein AAFR56_19945, partial [Chloroflexota bacterium]